VSLRELLHRSTFYKVLLPNLPTLAPFGDPIPKLIDYLAATSLYPKPFPFGTAFTPMASDSKARTPTTDVAFNYANDSFLTRIMPMFIGRKGGFRWKFQINTEDRSIVGSLGENIVAKPPMSLSVTRMPIPFGLVYPTQVFDLGPPMGGQPGSNSARNALLTCNDMSTGCSVAAHGVPALTVDFPDQSPFKFSPVNSWYQLPTNFLHVTGFRATVDDGMQVMVKNSLYSTYKEGTALSRGISSYVSASPEFNLFRFSCAPILFLTKGLPPLGSTTI